MAIKTKVVTLSSAQILALATTPVEILPATQAGKTQCILAIGERYNYGGTAYVGAITWYVQTEQFYTAVIASDNTLISYGGSVDSAMVMGNKEPTKKKIVITANANPTLGDGTVDLMIVYDDLTDQ